MPVQLEIVSPVRELLSRPVDMVLVPAYEGLLAAQEGHAPIIALLRGGVVTLYEGGQPTDRYFVGGGFVEIVPDRCTILADDATPVGELDAAAAQLDVIAATELWETVNKTDPGPRDEALDRLDSAREKLRVAQGGV